MFIGIDINKNRISAKEAIKGEEYRCPLCDEKLELRQGEVRIPHFAHWKNRACIDSWSHDMSEWHYTWQDQFPTEQQEVVVEFEGKKHRADVLIKEHKVVIEFQHSNLSAEEFDERNTFYNNCGYHVIWLFDMTNDFLEERISLNDDNNSYLWKRPWGVFAKRDEDIIVFGHEYNSTWKDVNVFFENNWIVERVFSYDLKNKTLITSKTYKDKLFEWTKSTFLLWLKNNYISKNVSTPYCPKCRAKMEVRRGSWGNLLWGCVNWGTERNCNGIIFIDDNPFDIFVDNKCPYCGGTFFYDVLKEGNVCNKCNFTVNAKFF